jgi:hypothetical protein
MPAIDSTILVRADGIVGEPTIASIWLQTKPLPWYTLNSSGIGAISELLLMVASAAYRCVFPKPRNNSEALLDHSGTPLAVQAASELVVIASRDQGSTRESTHELRRFPLSALTSCNYN